MPCSFFTINQSIFQMRNGSLICACKYGEHIIRRLISCGLVTICFLFKINLVCLIIRVDCLFCLVWFWQMKYSISLPIHIEGNMDPKKKEGNLGCTRWNHIAPRSSCSLQSIPASLPIISSRTCSSSIIGFSFCNGLYALHAWRLTQLNSIQHMPSTPDVLRRRT